MCGRYTLSSSSDLVSELFDLDESVELSPRYNIAPSQEVAAVRLEPEVGRALRMLRWGLVPAWQKAAPGFDARMINARAETAAQKPAFRDAFRRRRCLLPADGFFEWKKLGQRKQPYVIRMQDGRPFAFAGLWERWHGEDGAVVESCAILTTEPNELMREIHDRMPVILPPADYTSWLDPGEEDPDRLSPLLRPYPAGDMLAYPVSPHVNSPRHDDPSCVEPFEPPPPPQGDLFG